MHISRNNFSIVAFIIAGLALIHSPICNAATKALETASPILDGGTLNLIWGIPFAGILLSLAFIPLFLADIWHSHYGKIALGWGLSVIIPLFWSYGFEIALTAILHTYLIEYIPFIILAGALYTISGGIKIEMNMPATPAHNVGIMIMGTFFANVIGTTGAAMLFIRPLMMVNMWRKYQTHIIIFFIFLVCNLGGSLTALGDPPLFLGFLNGIDFFWPTTHLLFPLVIIVCPLMGVFYLFDHFYYSLEKKDLLPQPLKQKVVIEGWVNFGLLLGVMVVVLASGTWKPEITFRFFQVEVELQNVSRDCLLVLIAVISLVLTPQKIRLYNRFSWQPILEVAKLFAAIFITAMPVVAMLDCGLEGPLANIVGLVNHQGEPVNKMYFWMTGFLSAFLDNAPTYLIFFHMAGGDAMALMGPLSQTLVAISCGAVFMGAMTYIGNAPNFMVKSLAEENNILMPSFFGYIGWSLGILFPLFIILSLVLF
ncbi:MAG: sodium:proton antiporter [Alphaproteobacteria bacterium]|nr:sodium:proton antiporter [Alphaproteobacteria bacterium]